MTRDVENSASRSEVVEDTSAANTAASCWSTLALSPAASCSPVLSTDARNRATAENAPSVPMSVLTSFHVGVVQL